jgi:hypothetical protein
MLTNSARWPKSNASVKWDLVRQEMNEHPHERHLDLTGSRAVTVACLVLTTRPRWSSMFTK